MEKTVGRFDIGNNSERSLYFTYLTERQKMFSSHVNSMKGRLGGAQTTSGFFLRLAGCVQARKLWQKKALLPFETRDGSFGLVGVPRSPGLRRVWPQLPWQFGGE